MIAAEREPQTNKSWGPQALEQMRQARSEFQDRIAPNRDKWISANEYFYDCLKKVLQHIVEPGKRVLAVRCETGHLLAAVMPEYGVGVEIGEVMVECARTLHPTCHFVRCDPEDLDLNQQFDYILFDHIFDTVDILRAFERLRQHCTTETQVVVINYNHLWQPVLQLASKLGLRSKFVEPNWISENDIRGFLRLAGFRPVRKHRLLLFPKWLPLFSTFMNRLLARLPGLRRLCLMQVMVARPIPEPFDDREVTVSVIVPCRNEKGNIQLAVQRIPAMGRQTEILFCDDKSTDGTVDEVRRMQALYPEKEIRLIEGPGICKAENVWTGFRAARGDALMILDADLSVMPEELPMFLRALASRRGDFINGSRLIYPMQHKAMKFANEIGNKFFGLLFSFLLDQRIKDTLCGTKVLWRRDWARMEANLGSWGIKDLWGDYELLFGASKLHLEIVEVPVHYQERIHGVTKMTRVFANGFRMLGICWHAWHRLEG
ncbi:MAG TPA: glycosyltransferase [Candidatus Cybelea sp.]|nr:glycosyltransferase [Candidatus Cybelea sp.]